MSATRKLDAKALRTANQIDNIATNLIGYSFAPEECAHIEKALNALYDAVFPGQSQEDEVSDNDANNIL